MEGSGQMSNEIIKAGDSLSNSIAELLDDYKEDVQEVIIAEAKSVGKQAVAKLKATSPIRTKGSSGYYKGWKSKYKKSGNEISVTVYNATHPGLTHLLEKGHVTSKGRTATYVHIAPVEEWANDEFLDNVKRSLK